MSVKEIEDLAYSTKKLKDLYSLPWKYFLDTKLKIKKGLKILILNTPCNGFGDIVFAMKLANYLIKWYKCKLTIATTQPEGFMKLGANADNLILLSSKNADKTQCRRFKLLETYTLDKKEKKLDEIYDLIFVAPLQADLYVDHNDIKRFIPYSDRFNTFFFSEYNDSLRKEMDFHTGIGDDRVGLLFTEMGRIKRLKQLKRHYSLIYLNPDVSGINYCAYSFISMLLKKYGNKYDNFDIVLPEWLANIIKKKYKKYLEIVSKYYDAMIIVYKNGEEEIFSYNDDEDYKKILYIRGDLFPMPNKDMLSVIKHSERDILLTGDQSITDALACCGENKNIFYQICPWKKNLSSNLAELLPNKYLSKNKTSCGTIKAIKYKSNYKKFIDKWDFRKLAKPKLDAIVTSVYPNKMIEELKEIISTSKGFKTFDKKLEEFVDKYE